MIFFFFFSFEYEIMPGLLSGYLSVQGKLTLENALDTDCFVKP